MVLRIGVDGDMALVQVGQLGIPHGHHGSLGNENGHRRPLGVVVLLGDVQHLGADHIRQGGEDIGQTLGVVLLVNVSDIVPLLPGGLGVAHVVDIEAEALVRLLKP